MKAAYLGLATLAFMSLIASMSARHYATAMTMALSVVAFVALAERRRY